MFHQWCAVNSGPLKLFATLFRTLNDTLSNKFNYCQITLSVIFSRTAWVLSKQQVLKKENAVKPIPSAITKACEWINLVLFTLVWVATTAFVDCEHLNSPKSVIWTPHRWSLWLCVIDFKEDVFFFSFSNNLNSSNCSFHKQFGILGISARESGMLRSISQWEAL